MPSPKYYRMNQISGFCINCRAYACFNDFFVYIVSNEINDIANDSNIMTNCE